VLTSEPEVDTSEPVLVADTPQVVTGPRYVREGFLAGLAGLVATIPVLQYWRQSFGIPTVYEGDATFYLMMLQGMHSDGGYLSNPSLGWPNGQELHDLPQGADNAHLLFMQMLSWFLEPAVALNLFYVLSFGTVTAVAHVVLRRLEVRPSIAIVGALLYAFLPYHMLRGTSHLLLSSYGLVPMLVLLSMAVMGDAPPLVGTRQGRWKGLRGGRETWWVLAACAGLGSTGSYYGVFAAWLIGVSCILTAIGKRSLANLWSGLCCCATIAVVALINLSPTIWYWVTKGPNPEVATRLVQETELYGLRLQQFFMPRIDHRVPALGRVGYRSFAGPVYSEQGQTLGVVVACGLVITVGALFIGVIRRQQPDSQRWERVRQLGLIAVIATLTGTVSGIAFLIAMAGLRDIRSWNRIVVVVGFCAVAGLALAAEAAYDWAIARWNRRTASRLGVAVLVVTMLIAWFDQTSPRDNVAGQRTKVAWESDKEFYSGLADSLPVGSAVFSLPLATFPEGGSDYSVGLYDHARGYIHAPSLNWSYGAMRGRVPPWTATWADLPGPEMRATIREAGFEAIVIDRYGFKDLGAEIVDRLGKVAAARDESPDTRYVWFDLSEG
jgi:phosphoglycerol transferase